MKKLLKFLHIPHPLPLVLCLVIGLGVITTASATHETDRTPEAPAPAKLSATVTDEVPSELPTAAGIRISTLNQYTMAYSHSYQDEELDGTVLVFKLSDAGKLEALTRYCHADYRLDEELAALKATKRWSDDRTRCIMNVQDILNELLLNAGGGQDLRYVSTSKLIKIAEETIATEEFQKFVEVTKPLAECPKTDARSLMLTYTEEELAEICENLRENAYGEWALRLRWLDEMEFSVVVPTGSGLGADFRIDVPVK